LLAGTSVEQIRLFFYDLRIQGLELKPPCLGGEVRWPYGTIIVSPIHSWWSEQTRQA